jgi:hypothetical protein
MADNNGEIVVASSCSRECECEAVVSESRVGKGRVLVSRTYPKHPGKDSEEYEEFEVGVFTTATASVTVPISITHNLGNYESVKTGVIVTMPCYVEELDECFEKARAFAEEKSGEMSDFATSYKTFLKKWRRGDYASK